METDHFMGMAVAPGAAVLIVRKAGIWPTAEEWKLPVCFLSITEYYSCYTRYDTVKNKNIEISMASDNGNRYVWYLFNYIQNAKENMTY